MVGVGDAHEIQQSRHDDEDLSIVGNRSRHNRVANVQHPHHDVESAGAHVTDKAQNIQNVAAVRLVDVALHQHAQYEHDYDGGHEQQSAAPALLNQVTGAGNEPAHG